MTDPRSATIYDVARACGVAVSTVSHAFSRPDRVSRQTAELIKETADRLGYRSKPLSSPTRLRAKSTIVLVVSDISNSAFFSLIRGAESAAADHGVRLIVIQESLDDEGAADERIPRLADGVVLAGSRMSDTAIGLLAQQRPLVVTNRTVPGVASVLFDHALGMRRTLGHLRELGHTAVTYLGGPTTSWAEGDRWLTLRETADEMGMDVNRFGPFEPTLSGGADAVRPVCRHGSTAVVSYNDLMAVGLIRRLAAMNVRVPDELSVIGFDDILGVDVCSPRLTRIAAPAEALGRAALNHLVCRPRDGDDASDIRPRPLPVDLIVRETTNPPRHGRLSATT